MQKRNPKGMPSGGRFAHSVHDDAVPMTSTISERLENLRGDEEHRVEFASLALASTSEACRQAQPDAHRIHIADTRYVFHALGVYDAEGNRVRLSEDDYREVQRRLDDVNPALAIREGLVTQSVDPEGRDRKFFYSFEIDETVNRSRAKELVGV